MVFTGNANPDLARRVVRQLHIPLGDASVGKFSDGEISAEINENVRGKDVFLIQPTCAPTNDNLMELVVMADAFRRSSASRITAVVPYFGYARQDRRPRSARSRPRDGRAAMPMLHGRRSGALLRSSPRKRGPRIRPRAGSISPTGTPLGRATRGRGQ